MFIKQLFILSFIFYLTSGKSCSFESKSVILEVNKRRIVSLSCDEQIKYIQFTPKFEGTIKLLGKNEVEMLITEAVVRKTHKVLINNYYETTLDISSIEQESVKRSLFEEERELEARDLLYTEDDQTSSATENTTPPSSVEITLDEFYNIVGGGYIDKDYEVNIQSSELVNDPTELLDNLVIDGQDHTFTFIFEANLQTVYLKLFQTTSNSKITNLRFIFDMSESKIIATGIFGDVTKSIFYNIHVILRNNKDMEISYTSSVYNGLFAREVKSTSLLHIGVYIENDLSINFERKADFGSLDNLFGFIAGCLEDDSSNAAAAGGLFLQTRNIKMLGYQGLYVGGLIGTTSVAVGDSAAVYNNIIAGGMFFGGLIGSCKACQISRSFVEMNDINMEENSYQYDVCGFVAVIKSQYSYISQSYFKLNGNPEITTDSTNVAGIACDGYQSKMKVDNVVIDIMSDKFIRQKDNVGYLIARSIEELIVTNTIIIGTESTPLIGGTPAEGVYDDVYIVGFPPTYDTPTNVPNLNKDFVISDYLSNITYPDYEIEGFTERSEIKVDRIGNETKLSYLRNDWDFYYTYPADLINPIDISQLTEETSRFTMKILPKRMRYENIRIDSLTNNIYDSTIYDKDIFTVVDRNVIVNVPYKSAVYPTGSTPPPISSPEGMIFINNVTYPLFYIIYYDSSKIMNVFDNDGRIFDISADENILVNILKDNMMRIRINCSDNIVSYSGLNVIEGNEELNFTYHYDATLNNTFDTSETCSFKFIGTTMSLIDININFHVKNEGVAPQIIMNHEYLNPRTKEEIDLSVSITTIPIDPVCLYYYCPAGLICNMTDFCIQDPNELIIIHINQTKPVSTPLKVNIVFNVTSADESYALLGPYNYEFTLNDIIPEFILEPTSLVFSSFTPQNSSYSISTTTVPSSTIKISVDLSRCNNNYEVNPMSYTLSSSNSFIGIFNVTPINTESIRSDFHCIIINNLETLAAEYSSLDKMLNVSATTNFVDLSEAPKLLYVNESEDENTIILHFDLDCYAGDLIKVYQNDTNCNNKFITIDPSTIQYNTCLWMDRKTLKIYYDYPETLPSPTTVYLIEKTLRSTETSSLYSEGNSLVTLRAATPEISTAQFDDGYTITINFNNEIGYGLSDGDLCSEIFNSTKSLGSSRCSFGETKKIIKMRLAADAEIIPDDIIEPIPNKIKGSINSIKYATQSAIVLPPTTKPTVKAVIDDVKTITSCQSLIIDGSLSIGGGSRSLIYDWENLSYVEENVTEYLEVNSAILTIPSGLVKEDVKFRLTVTNFFGDSHSKEIGIKVTSESILESSIEGSPFILLTTDKELYIKGSGNLIECGKPLENTKMISVFTMFNNSNDDTEINISNFTTRDASRLYFGRHSIGVGSYKIIYNVSMDGLNSTSELTLNVSLGDFSLQVDGDPVRSIPTSKSLKLGVIAKDLDNPYTSFSYEWSCESVNNNNYCKNSITSITTSNFTINKNSLTAGTYNFSVDVTDDNFSTRKMSTFILVTVSDDSLKLSFSIKSLFSNSTMYKPLDTIGLKANIEENEYNNLRYLWEYVSDKSINPLKSRNDSSLVYISCEKMNPKLSSHIIRFYIYKEDDEENRLFSDYIFQINESPRGGIIMSSSSEVSLGESILMSTSNWEGSKEFTYRFGVLINEDLKYLQPIFSSSNSYNGILPLGDKQNDYNLKLIVFVKDRYGGISNSSIGSDGKDLIISSHPISEIDKIENITKKLEENNNYDQIFNLVNGIKDQITNDISESSKCVQGNKSENDNKTCKCFANYTGTLCEKHIPIDGGLSVNYTQTVPDRTCGKVKYYRWKTCDNPVPQYGGKDCEIIKEEIIEIVKCENTTNVDGNWSDWGEWTECDAKCVFYNGKEVEGTKSRSRKCNNPPPNNEGKDCIGNSTEIVKCYKGCKAPAKLCPGEYLNDEGKTVGSICNGHGKCVINRLGCKEYEPNCHSSCECKDGYSGSSCQYTTPEYKKNKEIKNNLIKSIETAIENTILTSESMEQQSSTILNVINPPIDLEESSLDLTYKIIDKTITQLKNDKPLEISYNSINDYVKATSLLLKNEWGKNTVTVYDSNNKRNRKLEDEKEYSIGSQLKDLYKNISVIHYNQQYSAPLEISTDSLGISLIKADESFDPNTTMSINQAEVDLSSIINRNETTEIAIFDFLDNPNKDDSIRSNRTSGLVSITLSNGNGEIPVNDLQSPIYYRQRINDDTDLKHIRCSYYSDGDLKFDGVVLMGIIKIENGSNYALCSMLHLTDFTIQKKSIFPKMNFVNPIGDASLLGNYDSSNMLVPIILGSVLVLCIFFWIYTKCRDKNEDKIVSEEKARNFLLYGKLRPSKKEKSKDEKDEKSSSLKKHFFKFYYERLLDEHKLLAPGFQSVDELMEINRSQNVLCLTAVILTDTAVNALFFGSNPSNVAQVVTTSIISALVMLPVTVIIPFFFKFANSYKSHTLQSKSKNKQSRIKVLKNKFELIKKQIMNQNSTLFKYQSFMLIESAIFVVLELVFTIISLIVLPSGYITIVIMGLFIIYILETFLIFVVTTMKQPFYFMYMFVIDLLLMLFNFTIFVFYLIILGRNDNVVYDIWKFFYDISSTQEIYCLYIEDSLNCCGWNNINDYNVSDCTTLTAYVSGNQNSCKQIYYEKFDKYSALWIIYFLIGIIVFIPKLVLLVKYVLFQFNEFERVLAEEEMKEKMKLEKQNEKTEKEKEDKMSEEEKMKEKAAGEMLVRSCRKLLFKHRFIREKEYVIWLRNRKIRAGMIIFANFIVCLYILIMIYINLLYGVKFESSQANQWIISSVISMVIDVILQEPSMILLKTVASTTLGSILPF